MPGRLIGAILVSGAVLAGAVLAASFASAQEYDFRYPVCMRLTEWGSGPHIECSFTSIPQCNASASGRAAQCVDNPFYAYDSRKERAVRDYRRWRLTGLVARRRYGTGKSGKNDRAQQQ